MEVNSLYPIIVTENIDKTIEIYTTMFHFKVKHKAVTKNNKQVIVLSNDADCELEVIEADEKMQAGLYGMRMNVKDIQVAYKEAKDHHFHIIVPPVETNNGYNMMVEDLNGIHMTIVQHVKR